MCMLCIPEGLATDAATLTLIERQLHSGAVLSASPASPDGSCRNIITPILLMGRIRHKQIKQSAHGVQASDRDKTQTLAAEGQEPPLLSPRARGWLRASTSAKGTEVSNLVNSIVKQCL